MNRAILAAAGLAFAAALAGCGPSYDYLRFDEQTTPELSVSLGPHHVEIPAGIAVAFDPQAMDDGEIMEDVTISLASSDDAVLGLEDAYGAGYVMWGAKPGHATITVFLDGELVDEIPATVTAQ